jgi:hypothetical protein
MSFDRDILSQIAVDPDVDFDTHAAGTINGAGVDTRLRAGVVEGQVAVASFAASGQIDEIRLEQAPAGGGPWTDTGAEAFSIPSGAAVVYPILAAGKYGVRSVHAHDRHVRVSFDVSVGTADASAVTVRTLVHDTRVDLV